MTIATVQSLEIKGKDFFKMKGTEKVANWTDAEILSIAFADNDRR
jgi:hypothetical protein